MADLVPAIMEQIARPSGCRAGNRARLTRHGREASTMVVGRFAIIVFWAWLAAAAGAQARVTHVDIVSREPVANGAAFGTAGSYELITARVTVAEDPAAATNGAIVDLSRAPRETDGLVHATADLVVLKPVDGTRANGSTIVEIPNRGGRGILRYLDKATTMMPYAAATSMGDGFLLKRGFSVAWIGWQWDVPDKPGYLKLRAPLATEGARSLTGLVRSDFVPEIPLREHEIGDRGHIPYPVADVNDSANVLTVRDGRDAPRRVIARAHWHFAAWANGKSSSPTGMLVADEPFAPGHIYELVYRATDPVVTGMGFAAVRDVVAWMKRDSSSFAPAKRVEAFGISQSGRFLRHFLYAGMNRADDAGAAFDGVFSDVGGAGRGSFDHRFAQPSRDGPSSSSFDYPTDVFPFSDAIEEDTRSNARDGLLAHADVASVKLFESFGSYEYWSRGASLVTTTPDGKRDLALPDNVRVYAFAGSQHNPGIPWRTTPQASNPTNPQDFGWSLRALVVALDRWCTDGTAPPPSRYPRVADGTLVVPETLAFPKIPGVRFVPGAYHAVRALDFGLDFLTQGIDSVEPPRVGAPYRVLVPAVDKDGNERAGIRMPEVAIPLGTYTGWNPRASAIGLPELNVDFTGTFVPFARDAASRGADPRASIVERYGKRDGYLRAYGAAAKVLASEGYVLGEDVGALNALAERRWREVVEVGVPVVDS